MLHTKTDSAEAKTPAAVFREQSDSTFKLVEAAFNLDLFCTDRFGGFIPGSF